MPTDLDRASALSARLLSARSTQRRSEHLLARLLTELWEEEMFRPLGYASIEEYGTLVLDLTARHTRDLLRIGRALPGLPQLAAAMEAGELDWTKARELLRVVTPETEEAWIARAKAVPCRVLEQQVVGPLRGDLPPDEGAVRADPVRTFAVRMEAADHQVLRAALAALRARLSATPDELDDGALVGALARRALASLEAEDEGARPVTAERYRVVIEVCPACGDQSLPEAGVTAELSETVAAEAACDAEVVDLRPGPKQGHVTRTIPPAVRRQVFGRAKGRCEVPYCRNRMWLDVHHTHHRAEGGDHDPARLVCLCDAHHRAVHAGNLGVDRRPDGAVVVFRADGSVHVGRAPNAPRGDNHLGPAEVDRTQVGAPHVEDSHLDVTGPAVASAGGCSLR